MIRWIILIFIIIAFIGGIMSNSDIAYLIESAFVSFSEPTLESITRLMNAGHFIFWGSVFCIILVIVVVLVFKN